jgi:hypothetical protein
MSLISFSISERKSRRPLIRPRPLANTSFTRGKKQAPNSQRGHGSRPDHPQPQRCLTVGQVPGIIVESQRSLE